jgi:hypothetical protein
MAHIGDSHPTLTPDARQSQTCKFSNSCIFPPFRNGLCRQHLQDTQLSLSLAPSTAQLCAEMGSNSYNATLNPKRGKRKLTQRQRWEKIAAEDSIRFADLLGGAK